MSNREYLFFILGFYFGVGNMLHFSITRMDKEYKNDKLMRIVIILLCIVWPIFLVCINHQIKLSEKESEGKNAE